LRPRREDAHAKARLSRRRGSDGEGAESERDRQQHVADVVAETGEAEVDASLRPLARALLALAEQLSRQEEP
jgi:hypothetical protein